MVLEVLRTWTAEILTVAGFNGSLNRLLTYIRQNKDRVVGDGAEGTGVTAHNHEGTYGVTLGTDALDDDAVTTAKILDDAVTTAKILDDAVTEGKIIDDAVTEAKSSGLDATFAEINSGCDGLTATAAEINTIADGITATAAEVNTSIDGCTATADQINRIIKSHRIKNCELVYQTTDLVTVSFPWTEPGGTAWANVAGIDISKNVASGGNVKDGVNYDEDEQWYYLYLSNSYTLGQPVVAEFLLTQSAAGESGYTLIGAIYNNASYNIEPFDQYGSRVVWRDPAKVVGAGSQISYTDVVCTKSVPVFSTMAMLSGKVVGTYDDSGVDEIYCYITKNGVAPADDEACTLVGGKLDASYCVLHGSRDVVLDGSQVFEYKMYQANYNSPSVTVWVDGYYVR